jgi:predicted metalloprotease
MRYDDFRRSDDIDDRRDDGGGGMGGGGGFGLPMGGGGLGIGTIIVLGLVGYAFGIDPRILIGGAEILTGGNQAPTYQTDRKSGPAKTGAPKDEVGSMIAGILGEIDDRWSEIFQSSGQNYTGPRIVLFRNATNGGRCGMAQSAMGPFYCPPDKQIFLDTSFLPRRSRRAFAAARAVPANSRRPISSRMKRDITSRTCSASCRACSGCSSRPAARRKPTALQVKVELQADCLSGVWVNREEKKRPGFVEPGDIDGALRTATAIGDDTLQRSDGQGGARLLHPRLRRAAQAMVHDRLSAGHGAGLQHVCAGALVCV